MLDTSAPVAPMLALSGAAPAAAPVGARTEGAPAVDFSAVLAGLTLGTDLAEAPEVAPPPPVDLAALQAANAGKTGTVGKHPGKILPSGKQPAEPELAQDDQAEAEAPRTDEQDDTSSRAAALEDAPMRLTVAVAQALVRSTQPTNEAPPRSGEPTTARLQPKPFGERHSLKSGTALPLVAAAPLPRAAGAAPVIAAQAMAPIGAPQSKASASLTGVAQASSAQVNDSALASAVVASDAPQPAIALARQIAVASEQPVPVVAASLLPPLQVSLPEVTAATPAAVIDAAPATNEAAPPQLFAARSEQLVRSATPERGAAASSVQVTLTPGSISMPGLVRADAAVPIVQQGTEGQDAPSTTASASPGANSARPIEAQAPAASSIPVTAVSAPLEKAPAPNTAPSAESASTAAGTDTQAFPRLQPAHKAVGHEDIQIAKADALHSAMSLRATAPVEFTPTPSPEALMSAPTATDARSGVVTLSASAAEPRAGQDIAALVDRIVDARAAAAPDTVRAALVHQEFGSVSLRLRTEDSKIHVTLGSADPGFAPAVHAAAAASLAGNTSDSERRDQPASQTQHYAGQDASAPQAQTSQQQQSSRNPAFTGERLSTRDNGPGRNASDQTPQSQTASTPDRRGGVYA